MPEIQPWGNSQIIKSFLTLPVQWMIECFGPTTIINGEKHSLFLILIPNVQIIVWKSKTMSIITTTFYPPLDYIYVVLIEFGNSYKNHYYSELFVKLLINSWIVLLQASNHICGARESRRTVSGGVIDQLIYPLATNVDFMNKLEV